MHSTKKQIRIGDLAQELGVKKFVIRFWEKEFCIKPRRSEGQQRFYHERDVELLKTIKSLLYDQGFTISGAKKQLESGSLEKNIQPGSRTTLEEAPRELKDNSLTQKQPLTEQMISIQKQLLKLKELLQ
jgi:DNA-binding transcriptional MerR regulator